MHTALHGQSAQQSLRALIRNSGGPELLERLDALEADIQTKTTRRKHPEHKENYQRKQSSRHVGRSFDVDVVIAGGGLSLLLAPLFAKRGLSVAICDRGRVGTVHRGWNASRQELQALTTSGLLSAQDTIDLIEAEYDHGVCRWHGGGSYPVYGVLDCAVDAQRLLKKVRDLAAASPKIEILDYCSVIGEQSTIDGIEVTVQESRMGESRSRNNIFARVMIDARGISSPYADHDLICPTVGGVFLEKTKESLVGDILTTIDPPQSRVNQPIARHDELVQEILEGFPGKRIADDSTNSRENTIYLFYYDDSRRHRVQGLHQLYASFFKNLSRYNPKVSKMLRPTFGYISGWSRLYQPKTYPPKHVFLVGDAAALHSPLTYCGFGHALRSLNVIPDQVARYCNGNSLVGTALLQGRLMADHPIHKLTGGLTWMMANPHPQLNRLLDAAFCTLHEMGNENYADLLQDRMSPRDFIKFMNRTSLKIPRVYLDVFRQLPLSMIARWGKQIASEGVRDWRHP